MPKRPGNLPEEAFWSEKDGEWVIAERDADERYHGTVRFFRPDGTICCETEYVHGTPHGRFTRFHNNGEPSRTGTFRNGVLHGVNVFTRSTGPTEENFPSGLSEVVWRCEMEFRDNVIVEGHLYDRQGRRIQEDGTPFPEQRPPGVPEDAFFGKDQDGRYLWMTGRTRRNPDETYVREGIWQYWDTEGKLLYRVRYVDGEPEYVRPDNVPQEAIFVEDQRVWAVDPLDEEGRTHGELRAWRIDGSLWRSVHYEHGSVTHAQEYLHDGSLAQEVICFDGGVPRRKWFRRTPEEFLPSFPNVLDEYPEAHEVEYLFDDHGFMSIYRILDGSGHELKTETVYRNAANDTDQARFDSVEEASNAWTTAGDAYTKAINDWLAKLNERGAEIDSPEPTFERYDLERAVIDSVVALSSQGEPERARALFPLYYDGIGNVFWNKYGLAIDRVLHAGDSLYARVHSPGEGEAYVAKIQGKSIERCPGVIAFGASHDKRYLAFAFDDRIEIRGPEGTKTLSYPRAYDHAGADRFDTPVFSSGARMLPRVIHVLPGGEEALLVSAEGIYVCGPTGATRLFPTDDDMDEHVGAVENASFLLRMDFPNADVSPSGDMITCGAMFRGDLTDHLAIFRRDGAGGWRLSNTSGSEGFFPIQAVFHRSRPHIAFALCQYASLHHEDLANPAFRIDTKNLEDGEIDEFPGTIAQEPGVVHVVASFGDGFLLGMDNGYVRWYGLEEDLQELGYLFVGGKVRHIDVAPDGRSFAVASDSGLVRCFTMAEDPSQMNRGIFKRSRGARKTPPPRNLITTMPVQDVACAAFWRTYPPIVW